MDAIISLRNKYKHRVEGEDVWGSLKNLYGKYAKDKQQSIVDALASGIALESMLNSRSLEFTPQMEEAFQLAYPNVDISSLADRSTEELAGFISGWKGKLFEVEVRDHLNAGEWVGDLHLQPGQIAELAESATQPGWDLAILGSDGSIVDQLQLKATESLSYIQQALEKYPDHHILTTAEIGGHLPDHLDGLVSATDISNDQITGAISDSLADSFGYSLLDVLLPGLPLALIGITEAHGVASGKRSSERAIERAKNRTGKTIVACVAGWIIGLPFGDFTGVLGGMVTRVLMGGEEDAPEVIAVVNYEWMEKRLENAIEVPRLLLPHYA